MKKIIIVLWLLILAGGAVAENAINIPYEDFKTLYADSIRQKILDDIDEAPFIYSIDSAHYKVSVGQTGGICEAIVSGALVSGKPKPFSLFSDKMIIRDIIQVTGGSLLCNRDGAKGIEFLPSGTDKFFVKLTFFISSGEDNRSGFVQMMIPEALKNSLSPKTIGRVSLTEIPGVKTAKGDYHFSPRSSLKIRFTDKKKTAGKIKKKDTALSSRYKSVSTPPIVLDSVYCFTSFEESGNILSVIAMTIPPEAGDSFKIKAVPNASIWSCKVNGKKMKVYSSGDKDEYWILPLAKIKKSHVELALLRKGRKMGLRGRLELGLPQMDLPARAVKIAIGLPHRVELMSFEGPVAPDSKFKVTEPDEFIGKPYYFSRSFYKGEGIEMAVSYKEPVKQ